MKRYAGGRAGKCIASMTGFMRRIALARVPMMLPLCGCGGDARVELAAADALDVVAEQVRTTLNEYHGEVDVFDDGREAAVTADFIRRIRRDGADEATCDRHAEQFAAALSRIRRDREVELRRFDAARAQADTIVEIARGLRRIGIESLSLQDEMRRYLSGYIETIRRAKAAQVTAGPRVTSSTRPAAMPTWLPAAQKVLTGLRSTCVADDCEK